MQLFLFTNRLSVGSTGSENLCQLDHNNLILKPFCGSYWCQKTLALSFDDAFFPICHVLKMWIILSNWAKIIKHQNYLVKPLNVSLHPSVLGYTQFTCLFLKRI